MTKTYQIFNFLNNEEVLIILNVFDEEFEENGFTFLDSFYQINDPLQFKLIREFLDKKIHELVGDYETYKNIKHLGNIDHNCDFILKQYQIFMPHTDKVFIPDYNHYVDLIFPLLVDNNVVTSFYTCHQRYYEKACHLKYKSKLGKHRPIYADIFNEKPYELYGVEHIDYENQISEDWLEKNIGDGLPHEYFNGLTIKKEFDWIPGSVIIQNPSIVHGPTNYRLKNAEWKMGMTIRIFKSNV